MKATKTRNTGIEAASLAINKVRGIGNVASYALYSLLRLVLNREAVENLGRLDKAVSPILFNT
jgi:hypothetical protein